MPSFSPPIVNDVPALLPNTRGPARDLWKWHSGRARGMTVIKEGGVYTTLVTAAAATQARLDAAQVVYLGGHIYSISDAEAAALIAAGYTVVADPVQAVPYPSSGIYPAEDLYPGA